MGRLKLTIDADRCAGHGRCYAVAPMLIEDDDEGHARVANAYPSQSESLLGLEAVRACPERAIELAEVEDE